MANLDPQTQARIKNVLVSTIDLKPLPTTVSRALKLMDEPDTSIKQLVSTLSADQALTARILKQANSAYYGLPYPSTTLHQAIARLGFRRTKNILFTLSYSSLLGRRVASYNLGNGVLWRHSIAVAMTAQQLSERVSYPVPDEAYIGGLLHDIGKLMLDQHFKVNWEQLLTMGQIHNLTLSGTEERLLKMNHAQVGGELARKWDLPACLVEAIAYHHTPALATETPKLTAIVHIANIICLRLGIGLADPIFLTAPNNEALHLLALDPDDIDLLTDHYKEMLETELATEEELLPSSS